MFLKQKKCFPFIVGTFSIDAVIVSRHLLGRVDSALLKIQQYDFVRIIIPANSILDNLPAKLLDGFSLVLIK